MKTKIGFLGAGSWGFCLASLLASKGFEVICWTTKQSLADQLNRERKHPFFPKHTLKGNISFVTDLDAVLQNRCDVFVESVTSAGIRPVFEQIKQRCMPPRPIILTSKGIEQNSGLILPEVVIEILGENYRDNIALISGPSFAQEVIAALPTSVVGSAFSSEMMNAACALFRTESFRVYPNTDIYGVAYGGALKNVIAIACGISDGLALGSSAKAALMTRGLHEVCKLAAARGCKPKTLNGLSGMGDFVLTCSSSMSRNFRYGLLLAAGKAPTEAEKEIGMVVEGVYTALSALQLGAKCHVAMPITEAVHQIISGQMKPSEAVFHLMQRIVKEEHL